MCGIIGYTGKNDAVARILGGLHALEYRGYDSSGIAAFSGGGVLNVKCAGRVDNLTAKLCDIEISSTCAIGHTRWATHGVPSDANSHPHTYGRVTVVHNGIIENYREIVRDICAEPISETDTEICAALIDSLYDGAEPLRAIFAAMSVMRGSYALAVIFSDMPGRIYAARKESPLLLGLGDDGSYITSDMTAVLKYTKRYIALSDLEAAEITPSGVFVYNASGRVEKEILTVDFDAADAERGGHAHFMEKEIFEEAEAVGRTISPRISNGEISFDGDGFSIDDARGISKITIVACGTARHAGLLAKHYIEKLARIPVWVEIASEYRYGEPMINEGDVVLAISQSGETADTLAAMRLASSRGAKTIAMVNVLGSTIARSADTVIYTSAGPEIAVASTKAYTVQAALLLLLAVFIAWARGEISRDIMARYAEMIEHDLPREIRRAISYYDTISKTAERYFRYENMFFIGRGVDLCLAEEGSLKLKEISYIHSEAYAAGELKHGTISLISEDMPTLAIMTCGDTATKTLDSIREIKARGGKVIALCFFNDEELFDDAMVIECEREEIRQIAAATYLQLFAYRMAVCRKCDVDKPRNLAKSVTVE